MHLFLKNLLLFPTIIYLFIPCNLWPSGDKNPVLLDNSSKSLWVILWNPSSFHFLLIISVNLKIQNNEMSSNNYLQTIRIQRGIRNQLVIYLSKISHSTKRTGAWRGSQSWSCDKKSTTRWKKPKSSIQISFSKSRQQ